MDRKAKLLNTVAQEIQNCPICPIGKVGKPVIGEGSPDARVVFVGEAPGKQEAATGKPFVGRSGKLLRQTIQECGLLEKDIYITSPVKYLPIKGTPTTADVQHGTIHLQKQIESIRPQVIVLLGKTACLSLLQEEIPLLKMHGEIIRKNNYKYLIAFHPAFVLRFPQKRKEFVKDIQKVSSLI